MWDKADEFMLEAAICMHRSSLQTCIVVAVNCEHAFG